MTTGEKLKQLRGLRSQQEIADELNERFRKHLVRPVTRDMYANWENDRNPFGWDVAKALGTMHLVTLDELIREDVSIGRLSGRRRRLRAVA